MSNKEYKPRMNEFLNYVCFRIEFYSLPTFLDNYVAYLANEFPNVLSKQRALSQAEMGLVDVDTIAWDLDLPIVSIIEPDQQSYVFDDIIVGGLLSKVYVNPYFVCIYIPIDNGNTINEETLESDIKRILNMDVLNAVAQIKNISCIANLYLNCTPETYNKCEVLDKDAFPQINPDDINSGRYSDSHQTDNGIERILIRDIIKGRDGKTDIIYLYVSITSISIYDPSSNVNFDKIFQELFNSALNGAARCFK